MAATPNPHITKGGMRRRNFHFPEPLMAEVKALADRKNIAMADVIRTAIEKYLAAIKKAEAAAKEAAHG